MDSPVTAALAEILQILGARVIRWNARGIGQSSGRSEWSSWPAWVGQDNCSDYKDIFREEVVRFLDEFPYARDCDLLVCGYSCGAIYATTIRMPNDLADRCSKIFNPIRYILVSYPIAVSPVLGLFRTGWYFRALEGLIGGSWEDCQHEAHADVLILMGKTELGWKLSPVRISYNIWMKVLNSKRRSEQGRFEAIVVDGANHVWRGKLWALKEEVEKWL
ncbi:uncharacterized protein BT62DRAFT_905912 [Guyanagaster necrorhizus]|uniref:Uncharacterized protein n=1 Tax=Guyanagaster necrorhizus TaxID=856835 RepID=A0A9P7VJR6_9AGAR|nr:uncharacterized protein BT62DRAFT_905912 [Guyanagaster necrorhizus MCA 3950]KAG7442408.1 hypothetical protein BT62DRAFT_905912 [Guyanagaster necrorhizus MCA 3950]